MTKSELLDQINSYQEEVDLVCEALEEMSDDYQRAFLEEGACDYWLTDESFEEMLWQYVENMIPYYDNKRANKAIEEFFIRYFDFKQFKRDCLITDYYRASNGVFLRSWH